MKKWSIEPKISGFLIFNTSAGKTHEMKVGQAIKMIKDDGWFLVRQKGSHRQYKHTTKKGLVTIAYHKMSDEIAIGTYNSILKQAQLKGK